MEKTKRRRVVIGIGVTVCLLLILSIGSLVFFNNQENQESYSEVFPVAESYSEESKAALQSVLHIESEQGKELDLGDLPSGSYSGFIFKTADASSGEGDVASKAKAAVDEGMLREITDDTFASDSLDTIASIFTSNQLEYVEPNYTLKINDGWDESQAKDFVENARESKSEDSKPSVSDDESSAGDGSSNSDYVADLLDEGSSSNSVKISNGGSSESNQTDGSENSSASSNENSLSVASLADNPTPDYPPNDPYYTDGSQWNIDMLNVSGAWALGLDGEPYVYNSTPVRDTPVKVAVIDTGLYGTGSNDSKHEDINYEKVDDVVNFATSEDGAPDSIGHGTFVSGLIAAIPNNGKGISGVMPDVTIVPCKVFGSSDASTEDVVEAIYYAVDEAKADAINMSLGGTYNATSLKTACDYAAANGVLVVASAGNDGTYVPNYPAAYDSVIGVASVDSEKARSSWSQYGASVFCTAPGESVTSTYIGSSSTYYTGSGTSFSGPMVAAMAGMVKAVYPDIDQDLFKQLIIDTSTDLGSAGFDDYYGYGLVNYANAGETVLASQMLPWYNLSFAATNEQGSSIDGIKVTLSAGEDISWDVDEEAGIHEAGSLKKGEVVNPEANGTYRVHRGVYDYVIEADGYYRVRGSLKTFTENQVTSCTMYKSYSITLNAKDAQGSPISGAKFEVVNSDGEREVAVEPADASQATGTSQYQLMSGTYTYKVTAEGDYRSVEGKLIVQRSDRDVDVVLGKSDEISSVNFTCYDADDDTKAGLSNAAVTVYDGNGVTVSGSGDGVYKLVRGHTYKAVATRLGYEDVSQEFIVEDTESQTVELSMNAAECSVTFKAVNISGETIEGIEVEVFNSSSVSMSHSADDPNRFNLRAGTYTYTLSASGYVSVSGTFSVSVESRTLTVILEGISQKVTFDVTDASDGSPIEDASIRVSKASTSSVVSAVEPGVYSLAPGKYSYMVYKNGYKGAKGEFAVQGQELSVAVKLEAYEGGSGSYESGSGTAEDPYLIANESQLRNLASQTDIVRSQNMTADTNKKGEVTGYYQLVNDIQLTSEWMPIGNYENSSNYMAFAGNFDGAGHTISGLEINESGLDAQGLFGYIKEATISNVIVEGSVVGDEYVGGIVGSVQYAYDPSYPTWNTGPSRIENCENRATVTGRYAVGGIVGQSSGGSSTVLDGIWGTTVTQCSNVGLVYASHDGEFDNRASSAGGIAGSLSNASVTYCYNSADVEAGYRAGGLVGYTQGNLQIRNSYNSGDVIQHYDGSGYSDTSGAIIGRAYTSTLVDCFSLKSSNSQATKTLIGTTDSKSTSTNTAFKTQDEMFRNTEFVSLLNTDSLTGMVSLFFTLGSDYPILSWQKGASDVLAESPRIISEPEDAAEIYKQYAQAEPITANAKQLSDGGTLTWQWYRSDDEAGAGAEPIEEAKGEGTSASITPSTEDCGTSYYCVIYTNTVSEGGKTGVSSTSSRWAKVVVRSSVDAKQPKITKLNANNTASIRTDLSAKVTTDLELSVEAEVDDEGVLSYQWYKGSNTSTGKPIDGATNRTYDVNTSSMGAFYYYVKVTNTLEEGNTAFIDSDWITVKILEYTISSYEELDSFRSAVNTGTTFEGVTVRLTEDISIPEGTDWEPIGSLEYPFCGTFMGGSGYAGASDVTTHEITGVAIDGDSHGNKYLGLFGVVSGGNIYDLVVSGTITGKSNVYTGLIVGCHMDDGVDVQMQNCSTTSGSSVEGLFTLGGLTGYTNATVADCANHATVKAFTYEPDSAPSVVSMAVGGVVGYAGVGLVQGCYNDGAVSVEPCEGSARCADYVGGVLGFGQGYYGAGIASCYNAGKITIGTKEDVTDSWKNPAGVVHAGAVCGYVSYDRIANVYFLELEDSYDHGTSSSDGYDYAERHTMAFMRTQYFLDMINDGVYASAFVESKGGTPHLRWEEDLSEADSTVNAAEPYIYDISLEGVDNLTSTFKTYFYKGENTSRTPIKVWVDSADGGALTYEWQVRDPGQSDQDWQAVDGASGQVEGEGSGNTYAPFVPSTETVGTWEYRCVVTNTLDSANGEKTKTDDIPAITIEIRDNDGLFSLRDDSKPNGEDNPYVITTPKQLAFLATIVNGSGKMVGVTDNSFDEQYFSLEADLDLAELGDNWTPIGYSDSQAFQGFFYGNNHSIKGMTINGDALEFQGLFGSVSTAIIADLELEGTLTDSGEGWVAGGVVGYAYGSALYDIVSDVDVVGYIKVGGVVAYAGSSQIYNCENRGNVAFNQAALDTSSAGYDLGGIVGYEFNNAEVSQAGVFNCLNSGTVTGKLAYGEEPRFGGIAGMLDSNTGVANNYYLKDSVKTADGSYVGTGRGDKDDSISDEEAVVEALQSLDNPEVAWKLNVMRPDGSQLENSGLWGNYDNGIGSNAVHLVQNQADKTIYHIDAYDKAANITVSNEYALKGDEIKVSWENKPGFIVNSVSYLAGGQDDVKPLEQGGSFEMPAADVAFVVEFEKDLDYEYALSSEVTLDGSESNLATIVLTASKAKEDEIIDVELSVHDGYQVKSLKALGTYGTLSEMQRIDGLHYRFGMPAEDVTVQLIIEPEGTEASKPAESLDPTYAATHIRSSESKYRTGRILHETLSFSGSALYDGYQYGGEDYEEVTYLETSTTANIIDQIYGNVDDGAKRYTGQDLASVLKYMGVNTARLSGETPVYIQDASGKVYEFTLSDITSLAYNNYDSTGQPYTRGLPVLMSYGCDGTPNIGEDGVVNIVFGQRKATDDPLVISGVKRIAVGSDTNYAQHVYAPFQDVDAFGGASDLCIRIYDDSGNILRERVYNIHDIENMANKDRGNIQRGTYTTYLYESNTTPSSEAYTDAYEGYDLYTILKKAGVPYEPSAKVQFYQTAEYGVENSWKTVDVSLGYLAGNGPDGEGDYSQNYNLYSDSVAITGVKPMLVYGKNGLPLTYYSGNTGVVSMYYNYRGPMMALLPQNDQEGGAFVGSATATTCYLGLIDIYLPSGSDVATTPADELESELENASKAIDDVVVSKDGSDVDPNKKWVTQDQYDAFTEALDAANSVVNDLSSTDAEIEAARQALQSALEKFEAAQKDGTYGKPSSGGEPSGGDPSSTNGSHEGSASQNDAKLIAAAKAVLKNKVAVKSLDPGIKKLKVAWSKYGNASKISGYEIRYSTSKSFKKSVKMVSVSKKSTSKTLKKLTGAKKYYVQVRAYITVKTSVGNKSVYSAWSASKKVKVYRTPTAKEKKALKNAKANLKKKASFKKVTSGKKLMKASIKKYAKYKKISGYEIRYSTDKKFKSAVKTKSVKKTKKSLTFKKLNSGKKYYVQIRAYTKIKYGGSTMKVYSSWSKSKTVIVR